MKQNENLWDVNCQPEAKPTTRRDPTGRDPGNPQPYKIPLSLLLKLAKLWAKFDSSLLTLSLKHNLDASIFNLCFDFFYTDFSLFCSWSFSFRAFSISSIFPSKTTPFSHFCNLNPRLRRLSLNPSSWFVINSNPISFHCSPPRFRRSVGILRYGFLNWFILSRISICLSRFVFLLSLFVLVAALVFLLLGQFVSLIFFLLLLSCVFVWFCLDPGKA